MSVQYSGIGMTSQRTRMRMVERLRTRHPGIKVLFMSGYSERAITLDGVMPPGTGFVEKPFTIEQLTRRTRELLDV